MTRTGSNEYDRLFFTATVREYVENPRFLARPWLAELIDSRLRDSGSGAVILTAEPGYGKSAFVAQLCNERPDILPYFVRRNQTQTLAGWGERGFLAHVGFQIALKYPLAFRPSDATINVRQWFGFARRSTGVDIGRLISSPFQQVAVTVTQHARLATDTVGVRIGEWVADLHLLNTSELQELALFSPARNLLKINKKARFLIVIDALDEMTTDPFGRTVADWLVSFPELPPNVKLLVTSRPPDSNTVRVLDKLGSNISHIDADTLHSANAHDVAIYINRLVNEPLVRSAAAQRGWAPRRLTAELIEKADGNIGYVDAVARAIDQSSEQHGSTTTKMVLSLAGLPPHLDGVYAAQFGDIHYRYSRQNTAIASGDGTIRVVDQWSSIYRPLLGILSVANAPLTTNQLGAFLSENVPLDEVARAVMNLASVLNSENGRFSLYHASVVDFLHGNTTHSHPELTLDPGEFHGRISSLILARHLRAPRELSDYEISNLVLHLASSNRCHDIAELLDSRWLSACESRAERGFGGFIADLERAWSCCSADVPTPLTELARLFVLRKAIYERLERAADLELDIVYLQGRRGEALAKALALPDTVARVDALLMLYNLSRHAGQSDLTLLDEALRQVADIDNLANGSSRYTVTRVAWLLANSGQFSKAIEMARNVHDAGVAARSMMRVAQAYAAAGLHQDALNSLQEIEEGEPRITALLTVGLYLAKEDPAHARSLVVEAADIATSTEDGPSLFLFDIIWRMVEIGMIEDALGSVASLPEESESERAGLLLFIASTMISAGDSRASGIAQDGLALAREIKDPYKRLKYLHGLALFAKESFIIYGQVDELIWELSRGKEHKISGLIAAHRAIEGVFDATEQYWVSLPSTESRIHAVKLAVDQIIESGAGMDLARDFLYQAVSWDEVGLGRSLPYDVRINAVDALTSCGAFHEATTLAVDVAPSSAAIADDDTSSFAIRSTRGMLVNLIQKLLANDQSDGPIVLRALVDLKAPQEPLDKEYRLALVAIADAVGTLGKSDSARAILNQMRSSVRFRPEPEVLEAEMWASIALGWMDVTDNAFAGLYGEAKDRVIKALVDKGWINLAHKHVDFSCEGQMRFVQCLSKADRLSDAESLFGKNLLWFRRNEADIHLDAWIALVAACKRRSSEDTARAVAFARSVSKFSDVRDSLIGIALLAEGNHSEVERVISGLNYEWDRAELLASLAIAAEYFHDELGAEYFERSINACRSPVDDGPLFSEFVLRRLAIGLAAAGSGRRALVALEALEQLDNSHFTRDRVARELLANGSLEDLRIAQVIVVGVDDDFSKKTLIGELACAYAKGGYGDLAMNLVTVFDDFQMSQVAPSLSLALVAGGQIAQGLDVSGRMREYGDQSQRLSLAMALARMGKHVEAFGVLESVSLDVAMAYCGLLAQFVAKESPEIARAILMGAINASSWNTNRWLQVGSYLEA
jgi:tetratricopeptide (TPR) repeat protein